MKLAAATVLCALAAASPALAAEKNAAPTGLRRLGKSDVCSFLDFEGLWEGVDPSTGAIHNTEMDCTDDSGFMGRKCDVTIVVSYHAVCGGKTILQGTINGGKYGQFDQAACSTENVCTLGVTCPDGNNGTSDPPPQNLPLTMTQSATTEAVTSSVALSSADKAPKAFEVTLNMIGGGWKA